MIESHAQGFYICTCHWIRSSSAACWYGKSHYGTMVSLSPAEQQ